MQDLRRSRRRSRHPMREQAVCSEDWAVYWTSCKRAGSVARPIRGSVLAKINLYHQVSSAQLSVRTLSKRLLSALVSPRKNSPSSCHRYCRALWTSSRRKAASRRWPNCPKEDESLTAEGHIMRIDELPESNR